MAEDRNAQNGNNPTSMSGPKDEAPRNASENNLYAQATQMGGVTNGDAPVADVPMALDGNDGLREDSVDDVATEQNDAAADAVASQGSEGYQGLGEACGNPDGSDGPGVWGGFGQGLTR